MPLKIPEKIGRYKIINPIGQGGFASVYLGNDPYIKRQVALKISELGQGDAQKHTLERLFQEAEAAGALIHPNIVTIHDAGIQDPFCYIAMEYIEGGTLYPNCVLPNILPIADALDILIKILHGLDFAHQRGVIHRDVKPGNILLGANGDIKITDFGLACFKDLASADKRTIGTPSYMPPEQVEAKGSTAQSDLFSVGVIAYQLLCGQKPFEAQNASEMRIKIVKEPHVPLATRNPELPPELFEITDRALAKNPNDRYKTAFDFAKDLESVLHGSKRWASGKLGEHIKHLKTLKFFDDFSEDDVASLLNIGSWITAAPTETIISESEMGETFFVIVSGEAAVTSHGKNIRLLSRGDCFGEMSFLLKQNRTATILAKTDCNMLRLDPEKIDILSPQIQAKLYRLFARTIAGYLIAL